jgi:hypothetical protein
MDEQVGEQPITLDQKLANIAKNIRTGVRFLKYDCDFICLSLIY